MNRLAVFCGILLGVAIMIGAVSCEKDPVTEPGGSDDLSLLVSMVSEVEGAEGDVVTLKFYSGKGPKKGDMVVLKGASSEFRCDIVSLKSDSFGFKIPVGMKSGRYNFYIARGDQSKMLGEIEFTIEKRVVIAEKEGYNVYGLISCGGVGVEGVVVSDGIETTVTDKDGLYYLKSDEYNKFVFMSIPSGYEAAADGVIPKFHKLLDGDSNTTERADWTLTKVDNANHVMYILGDMHLANRTKDLSQFSDFTYDLNEQIKANSPKKQYALTLGDMSWDLYWYQNKYDLYSYTTTLNSNVKGGVQVFHTIGNHDHDMMEGGDYNTVTPFKAKVAPNYYSFNIGNVHYVVLDNILCTNTPAANEKDGSGRSYKASLTPEQISWMRKDLSYVDKSKVLVVTMHAQMYNETGSQNIAYCSDLENLCAGYETHVMSAHTHVIWNNDMAAKNIFHHNSGAVCGTWWWTGNYTSGLYLCKDGSPAGYYVYDMNGTDVKWRFKPTGKDFSHAFRTYDRNEIVLSAKNFAPKASSSGITAFEKSASSWVASDKNNYVYFNVFDYNASWTIEVTENGKKLSHEVVKVKDPLHLVAYEAQRYNAGSTPTSDFPARTVSSHIFRVKASSSTSTLEFKITDGFGNVYTESMARPKKFSIAAYK